MLFFNIPDPSDSADQPADRALESYLSREPSPRPGNSDKPKKKSSGVWSLLIAVLVVAALAAVIVILNHRPTPEGTSTEDITPAAQIIPTVNEEKQHILAVPTDADGAPALNGAGTLLDYVPADIAAVTVTNASGSFTVTSAAVDGATAYTLKGFESFPLQSGAPDAVANDAASLPFLSVVRVGGDPADFGLDNPRATVRASYADSTLSTILVGDEAPASAGVYVSLGDTSAVFLAADDAVDSFFYSSCDLISRSVTDSAESVETADFTRLTLSGTRYPDPIVIVPDDDPDHPYRVTAPAKFSASVTEAADIAGSVRGLYADAVVGILPEGSDPGDFLSAYGLQDTAYAEIVAEYPDTTIRLRASAPDSEGSVYLVNASGDALGGRIVYQIQYGALSWASASLESLRSTD